MLLSQESIRYIYGCLNLQERNGLDKIEIRDNGSGINISDVYNVCFSNYTSKIHNFNDLGYTSTKDTSLILVIFTYN